MTSFAHTPDAPDAPGPTSTGPGPAQPRVTRLAPSPTGALHLGNARTFLINWAHARQTHTRIQLRIDDLDSPRVKTGAAQGAIDDLQWLGMNWDGPPVRQTDDLQPYEAALAQLQAQGSTYRCPATRREVLAAASAPHKGDHDVRYPGLYRPENNPPPIAQDAPCAVRFRVPQGITHFTDSFAGPQAIDVQATVGDFLVATKAGLPAYQLAVVVDDTRAKVTDIIRGDDLLNSTPRQLLLYHALGLAGDSNLNVPRYFHVPLVLGPDGHRLAKRHGDTRVAAYRERGVKPERIIGLLAHTCGLLPAPAPMAAHTFCQQFCWAQLPPTAFTLTPEHDTWLLAHS